MIPAITLNEKKSRENIRFEQTGRIPLDHSRSDASSSSLFVSGSGRPSGPSLRALGGLILAGSEVKPPVPPLTTAVSALIAEARRRSDPANEDDDDSLRQWYYLLYVLFITIGILVINSYVKLSENCCFKDSINTLIKLYHTTLAYTIGCSWYILGYLCFQSIFFHLDKGYLLGLFLYSIIMTLAFVFANTIIALKNNTAEYCEPGTEHKNLASPKLLMVSGSAGKWEPIQILIAIKY
jgi:hypothetical protein